ncbi:olfactory receptor 10A3-like [Rhinophrynus dorsalis]
MTVYGCITQYFVYSLSTCIECLLLTVMAFDRYLAICNPLRYSSIMNFRICNNLVLCSWLSGFIFMISLTVTVFSLQFCGSNIIDHIFCDLAPILQIASSDTSIVETEALFVTISLALFPFLIIIISYSCIFFTILRIPSVTGRQKAFSTCSSHLTSVNTYFGTLLTIYLTPSHGHSSNGNKILSLLYIIGTPLFNPIIYSLRNQEMKTCLETYIFFHRVKRC